MTFPELVARELVSARQQHGRWTGFHQAYAMILEEVDELWEEVRKRGWRRDPRLLLAELVQIGACAQRAAEDLDLLPPMYPTVRRAQLEGDPHA